MVRLDSWARWWRCAPISSRCRANGSNQHKPLAHVDVTSRLPAAHIFRARSYEAIETVSYRNYSVVARRYLPHNLSILFMRLLSLLSSMTVDSPGNARYRLPRERWDVTTLARYVTAYVHVLTRVVQNPRKISLPPAQLRAEAPPVRLRRTAVNVENRTERTCCFVYRIVKQFYISGGSLVCSTALSCRAWNTRSRAPRPGGAG